MLLHTSSRSFTTIGKSYLHRLAAFCLKRSIFSSLEANSTMSTLKEKNLIACCQMTSTSDKEHNMLTCRTIIENAAKLGCKVIFLPECFDYVAKDKHESVEMAESLDGPIINFYKALCRKHNIWLSLGGFHQKGLKGDENRIRNTHIVLNENGEIVKTYDKMHLFSVNIKDGAVLRESEHTIAGNDIPEPVQSPVGKIGLQICYDVRFAEESILQRLAGAEILTYPSAFTVHTGMAHWEVLIRARAIENQCYVIAATQTGQHNETRRSYGHAMVVDPWGAIIAQASEGNGFCLAHIDLDYLQKVRQGLPVTDHRRKDVYQILTSKIGSPL